jgi:hypothetical protein
MGRVMGYEKEQVLDFGQTADAYPSWQWSIFPQTVASFVSVFSPMKLSYIVILLLALTVMRTEANLTSTSPKQVPVALPEPTPYAVTSRDANSRVWERTTYEQSPSGQIVPKQHMPSMPK